MAARLRPRDFSEYIGQEHIIGEGKLLRRAIEADSFTAIILYGPPGIGKTTLAELIANVTDAQFTRLSAVSASVKDVRGVVENAKMRLRVHNQRTILFLDEIHRFSRSQQDVLLPDVESGIIRLIGATTENPHHYIVGPLISRAQVFRLESLSEANIETLITRAAADERAFPDFEVEVTPEAASFWATTSEGDARHVLIAMEIAVLSTKPVDGKVTVDLETAQEAMQQKRMHYGDDGHYDTASAFIKSMRGSDPDAAIYWAAKMLASGEDPRFIARRIVIFASEDVGNADPRALDVAVSAMRAIEYVGMPEAQIILSQAVCYCATAPKSNAAVVAINRAMKDVQSNRVQAVPKHLRDAHYKGAKDMGHGIGYQYPHNDPRGFVAQDYLGVDATYYEPSDFGYEKKIKERIAIWNQMRQQAREESGND